MKYYGGCCAFIFGVAVTAVAGVARTETRDPFARANARRPPRSKSARAAGSASP